jgi:hypothetical protein
VKRTPIAALLVSAVFGVIACQETSPTSVDGELIPVGPATVEVILPWSAFGSSVETFDGFGSPDDLIAQVVAEDYRGTLDSRALIQFSTFPRAASVQDSLGETRADSSLTYLDGYAVARLDTIRSRADGPVSFSLNVFDQDWHSPSATWDLRVDTVLDQQPWAEPGAGPATQLSTGVWDPEVSDSVIFPLDSAAIQIFDDSSGVAQVSARVDMVTPGAFVELVDIDLRVNVRPSINEDTLVVLSALPQRRTFVYSPIPEPEEADILVGGAPAWRTVLTLDMPTELDGPASLCAQVNCPFALTPERLNYAAIILTSETTEPEAFQPTDTLLLDARPVLAAERLPKAPLGPSFLGLAGRALSPDAFGPAAGREFPIVVTDFIASLVDEDVPVDGVPRELSLLSLLEPFSVSYATFVGPGAPGEPALRLILTAIDTVDIR